MLRTLDPHSNFFDPRDYQLLREDQKGHYYGIGMQVGPRDGRTVVMAPFPGSPAYKAGLRPGDVIETVDGKPANNLTTTEVADLLKGPRGTEVTVTVSREGAADPLSFTLVRDEISRQERGRSILVAAGDRLRQSRASSTKPPAKNWTRAAGGSARMASRAWCSICETIPAACWTRAWPWRTIFCKRTRPSFRTTGARPRRGLTRRGTATTGAIIPLWCWLTAVRLRRRRSSPAPCRTTTAPGSWAKPPLGKAWCRPCIRSRTTRGLALTTAHFYTPSGRLIQRDYSNKSFFDYYYHKDGNVRNPARCQDYRQRTDGLRRRRHHAGPEVYDARLDRLELALYRDGVFNYTRAYFAKHTTALPDGWMPDGTVLADLRDYLLKHGTNCTDAEFAADHDWIARNLAKEMYTTAFNVDVASQLYARTDPEVQLAVNAMPQAAALLESARKVMVRRTAPQEPATDTAAAAR